MPGECEVCGYDTNYSENRCYEHEHHQEVFSTHVCCPKCGYQKFWKYYQYDQWLYQCQSCDEKLNDDKLVPITRKRSKSVEKLLELNDELIDFVSNHERPDATRQKVHKVCK